MRNIPTDIMGLYGFIYGIINHLLGPTVLKKVSIVVNNTEQPGWIPMTLH